MSSTANLGMLLRSYSIRNESAFIIFREFYEYIKKYAAHHLEERPNLIKYLNATENTLQKELEELASKHEIYMLTPSHGKTVIAVISYYSVIFANRYKDILSNPTIPFPSLSDLPKQLPSAAIEKHDAETMIPALFEKQDLKSPLLYCLIMPRNTPSILFPACVPVRFLTQTAMAKIKHMLKKDESHDYFQKKMRIANPGKEISSQTFFNRFIQQADNAEYKFETNGDSFYFWNQLCYFIRQDLEKIKDRTAEDINVMQAVAISEIHMLSIKEKAAKEQHKAEALKELEAALAKPPYFFSMNGILKLTDSKGALLYGQYGEKDLQSFLQKLSTENNENELPKILVFKVESGTRYFIYKTKVFPLVIRLSNEAHDTIEKKLTDKWFNVLKNYEKLPEMKESKKFEEILKQEVRVCSPVLYALLNANFLTLLNYEANNSGGSNFNVFAGGKLIPYSELLMINHSTILANAKLMLPFWYTIPLISWLAGFFTKKPKKAKDKTPREITSDDIPDDSELKNPSSGRTLSKKEKLAETAKNIIGNLIPEGSTIDRELDSYLKQWNKMITKEAHIQLTEDVNSLIRDYTRRVIKTISTSSFTLERIQSLAESLVNTPNMQKIKEEDALYMYVQLYILRLVINS